jgi:hypothetical protein
MKALSAAAAAAARADAQAAGAHDAVVGLDSHTPPSLCTLVYNNRFHADVVT